MTHDLTDLGPTKLCFCGGNVFRLLVSWSDENEVGGYDKWMYCDSCDTRYEAPMPGVNC